MICLTPFTELVIEIDGSAFLCCPCFIGYKSIGNFYEKSLEEIWLGAEAEEFRAAVRDKTYKFYDRFLCGGGQLVDDSLIPTKINKPKMLTMNLDGTCNLRCPMCRDEYWHDQEKLEQVTEQIDKSIIPFLSDGIEILKMNGRGEFFASDICKQIAIKSLNANPNLKLVIWTNGILCTKENIQKIGGFPRIDRIRVSLDAASERTYNKIRVSDNKHNFGQLIKNLKYISEQKKKHRINTEIDLVCVISKINYKEIKKILKIGKKLGFLVVFWAIEERGSNFMKEHLEELDVSNINHKNHKDLLKILKDSIFDHDCIFEGKIKNIRDNL